MKDKRLSEQQVLAFKTYLIREEKSTATVEKYLRDVRAFCVFAGDKSVSKDVVLKYKKCMQEKGYAVASINSMLASVNSFLKFLGWENCRVKSLRRQRAVYLPLEKELTIAEYQRLLTAAKGNPQLELVIATIGGTGIRVSELRYFTIEAVRTGEIQVNCKGKIRTIMIPGTLRKRLVEYAKNRKIQSGPIFLNRLGRPLHRSTIWAQMKRFCKKAKVNPKKVFPHNLRRLFARTFYKVKKDIAKLADILGHSSIETTRIYIMTTGTEHRRVIEKLGLVT